MKPLLTTLSRLEPARVAHAAEMLVLLSDPRIYEYLDRQPPASLQELEERYRRYETTFSPDGTERWLNWIIFPHDSGACAGFMQASVYADGTGDFGYILGPAYWGRGLAFVAASAVIRVLHDDFAVTALYATADRRNERSIRLLNRLGFQRTDRSEYPHGEAPESDDVFRLNLP
jgi:ribosomal-protein-alanine N-acetyltransferase